MSEIVILNSPLLLLLYGLALAVNIFDLVKKTGGILPVLSACLVVGTSAYALLLGAGFYEVATVILAFLLLNLFRIRREEE